MMHKKSKINKKQSKGITLIALVITIIVLLILAGVTINTLFDNGNAIDKAAEARDETNKGNIKEQLDLAVITSRINDNNANMDTGKLESELKKLQDTGIIDSYKPSESDFQLPSTVTKDNYEFTIDEDGNVTIKSENAKKAEKINKVIGQTVEYTDQENNENSQGWRVFYASEDEMFLIAADTAEKNKKLSDYDIAKYKGTKDGVFSAKNAASDSSYSYSNVTYGQKYNSMWFPQIENISDDNPNFQATAYLCDPQNWEKYISTSAPKGTYAVGGPTKELFLLSWNESYKNEKLGEKEKAYGEQKLIESDVTAAGYAHNKPQHLSAVNTITTDILEGLYNTATGYFLVSPSSYSTLGVCYVFPAGCLSDYGCRIRRFWGAPDSFHSNI